MIRPLTTDDLDAWIAHMAVHFAESGTDGELPYGPYGRDAPFEPISARETAHERWTTLLDQPGWRRVWGAFIEDGTMVGHVALIGSDLESGLHRAQLGLGVQRAYQRRGHGSALMEAALKWARADSRLSWIDLGVFKGNDHAERMYEQLGFKVIGRKPDIFRVDGVRIDNISMTLWVGSADLVEPT